MGDDSTITILKLPLSCINTTTTISIDSCPVGIAVELPKCALPERRCRKRSTKPSTLTRTLTRLPQQKSHQDAACDSSDSDMASSDPFAPITPLVGFDPFAASAAQSQSQDDSCISEQTSMRSDEEKICSSDTSPVSQVNEAAREQELVQDQSMMSRRKSTPLKHFSALTIHLSPWTHIWMFKTLMAARVKGRMGCSGCEMRPRSSDA